MEKTCWTVYRMLRKGITVIAGAIALLAFFLNFIYQATVAYDASEKVTISRHLGRSVLMLAVVAVLMLAYAYVKDRLPKLRISERKLFLFFSAVYAVFALYLILNVEPVLRADARSIFHGALHFAQGDYGDFAPRGYFARYPHQLGLMAYDSLLQRFSQNPAVSFAANFLMILGINYFSYKMADLLFENKAVNLLTIVCSFAFLPQFFFMLFAYGIIPGFFCMMAAFYFALSFHKTHRIPSLVWMAVCSALAVIFKKSLVMGVMAILLYSLIELLRDRNWIKLVAVSVLIPCMVLPGKLLTAYYEYKTGEELDNGVPAVLWIAMGTDLDNDKRAPGWYDGSNINLYAQAGYDKESAAEKGREKLAENLKKMKADPSAALRFFTDKTVSQWCEPLYQSLWSGPLAVCDQETYTELLQSLYGGTGKGSEGLTAYAKLLTLALWALAFVFLMVQSKKNHGYEMIFMFVIGGFFFHLVWEGKSQHTYPYVFVMIPFAMYALYRVAQTDIKGILKKLKRREANALERGV